MKPWEPTEEPEVAAAVRESIIHLSPPTILALGFLVLILVGTLLLKLPYANKVPLDWLAALFTATSAVTVTGLAVVETATQFTLFGQIILLFLIQAGGLGFMTFAVVGIAALGKKVGLEQQKVAKEAFNQTNLDNLVSIAKSVIVYSFTIELIGASLLVLFWPAEQDFLTRCYYSLFYTISAFNNAGFALTFEGLIPYANNAGILLTISLLFIVGGIGFTVLMDLRQKKQWSALSTNTRLVLLATFVINGIAFLLIWLLECNNPNTLGPLSFGDQALAAWFQAVTPRTAGFNSVDISQMTASSMVIMLLLMFIGGGSLSTAGGIKLGTFVVLIMATYAFLRQRDEVVVLKRTIPIAQVMKSLALIMTSIFLMFMGIFLLDSTEKADFLDIVFEVVSALSTVGLSRGLTTELSDIGRLIVIFLMIAGRLGPLTLAFLLAKPKRKRIRYAETDIQIG